jgi:hypothetical protein
VRIPYHNDTGEEKAVRFRRALTGHSRFAWRQKSTPLPYGLERLAMARSRGYVVLVEGERNTVTLWHHDIPAVGLPGAGTWQDDWSVPLSRVRTIYVVVEPDSGGKQFLKDLSDSDLHDRLRVIYMTPEAKDANALYLSDPESFPLRMQELMAGAKSLHDMSLEMNQQELAAAEALCKNLVSQPDILDVFGRTIAGLGIAAEERTVKLLYLVLTSRNLKRPVPVIMKGVSSSGKTYLAQQVCRFFPESAVYTLSAMSEHALIHNKESFKHRFIIIDAIQGMEGRFVDYIIRSLVSEGHIRYSTLVETKNSGWEEKTFEKEGPTGLIIGTTRVSLHPENETRMFSIQTDDSPEQTKRIFLAQAEQEERDESGDEALLGRVPEEVARRFA